jgi:hypothetical protein
MRDLLPDGKDDDTGEICEKMTTTTTTTTTTNNANTPSSSSSSSSNNKNDIIRQQQKHKLIESSFSGTKDRVTISLANRELEMEDLDRFLSNLVVVSTTITSSTDTKEEDSNESSSSSALLETEKSSPEEVIPTPQTQTQIQMQISSLPILTPTMMMMTHNIVRLDLSRNKLTSLPKELCCPMLEYLDVGRNNLKGLPSEIGNCTKLKTLIALSNNIRWSQFPIDAITSYLPLLEELDLRWNRKMNTQSTRKRLLEDKKFINGCRLILSPADDNVLTATATATATATTTITKKKKLSACDRDANDLRSQLEPISTPQLRKRLHRTFGVSFDDNDENAYDRESIMQKLLKCYENNEKTSLRSIRYERGVYIDPKLLSDLLTEMEKIPWPRTTRERPKILAEGYVILQRPPPPSSSSSSCDENIKMTTKANNKAKNEAKKLQRFNGIWTKAIEAIESIDKSFAEQFTALAVTKNFQGSAHIDTLNIAPFYGLSLGNFTGGKLCVECSPTLVAEIDTKGKLAKVDGRFVHWVSDHEGTRYSLIYYVTSGEVVPQTTAIFKPPHAVVSDEKNQVKEEEEEEEGKEPSSWVPPPVFVR